MKHLDVPSFFPNGAPSTSPKRDWWLRLVRIEAHSSEQARPFIRGGFLTINPQVWLDDTRYVHKKSILRVILILSFIIK